MQSEPEINDGAVEDTATASHLHRSAMELSYQALNAYSSGLGKVSQELFKLALKNELAAMAVSTDEGLPSRAVLQRSAAFLAHQAGADEQAADLARHCLSGNLPKYLIQQLFDIVSSYQEPYSPF